MTMTIPAENAATSNVSIITRVDASAVDRATASVRPMPRPIAHSRIDCFRIRPTTPAALAPSAMRMPISFVRLATA